MANPFVVLEGLDGVGKSTCAKLLAAQCGGVCVATPMQPFRQMCQEIDAIEDLNSRFHFFLSAVVSASIVIDRLLTNQTVICDRYLYTTLAYHRAMGVLTEHINIARLPIVEPSHVFMLTATEEVRHRRLSERGLSPWDKKFLNDVLVRRLKEEFNRFKMISVDTTNICPAEVVKILLSHLQFDATAVK